MKRSFDSGRPAAPSRREALALGVGGLAALRLGGAGGPRVFAAPPPRAVGAAADAPRALLLLQLSGGNDGLDTVVPWADDAYHVARPRLGRWRREVLRIDDARGFHPGLRRLHARYEEGQVAVIEGAGYPNPNRSHFKSLDIWHTARPEGRAAGEGWIGRLCRALFGADSDPNRVVHVGRAVPYSLHSSAHPPACFADPAAYRWVRGEERLPQYGESVREQGSALSFVRAVLNDARQSSQAIRRAAATYRPAVEYPRGRLADGLRAAAAVLQGRVGARVVSVEQTGFDTHVGQPDARERLLDELDGALAAFLDDLADTDVGRNVLVLVFSEFGRRVSENGSGGTDHGTAGPMFLVGAPVGGGLYGAPPSLTDLDENGDLVHTTDFRSVYATVVEDWFGAPARAVLGAEYSKLGVLAAER